MPLSAYNARINKAVGDLCVRNPSLLSDKGELLMQARIAVDQGGYQYKKGKSRSKFYGEQEEGAPTKRPKLDRALRLERLSQIREEVATISQQLSLFLKKKELRLVFK